MISRPERETKRDEVKDLVRAGICVLLSVRECRAVELRRGIGCPEHSVDEIAAALDIRPTEVRRLLSRAEAKLRKSDVMRSGYEALKAALAEPGPVERTRAYL